MCQAPEIRWLLVAPTPRRHLYSCVWQSVLVVRSGSRFPHLHLFHSCQMRRSKIERHVVDLAVEPERHLVVLIVDPRAGIDPDVEGLVRGQQEWNGFGDLQSPNLAAVDLQHSGAALCDASSTLCRRSWKPQVSTRRRRSTASSKARSKV